jgi:SAM-dependent methyltransferase
VASAAAAFDAVSSRYDADFGTNPVGLLFRHVFQERLLALFRRGASVIDLGCGTAEDAAVLAARGVRVHALDASEGMIACARAKLGERGGAGAVTLEVRRAEEVGGLDGAFDGAYSDFGALNCTDLSRVGQGLARVLRPGAPVLLSLLGPWPLPSVLARALTGQGEARRDHRPSVGGRALDVSYPSLAQAGDALGPAFAWTGAFALGVVVPDPDHAPWVTGHPQAFGLLAALEGLVRRWPLVRGLGDHLVLEGRRR